jgi:hypothetical protein
VGPFSEEDVASIQKAVRGSRWSVTRSYLADHEFGLVIKVCVPEMVVGRVFEIHSTNTLGYEEEAVAYSRGRQSGKRVIYTLHKATNGWQVLGWGI